MSISNFKIFLTNKQTSKLEKITNNQNFLTKLNGPKYFEMINKKLLKMIEHQALAAVKILLEFGVDSNHMRERQILSKVINNKSIETEKVKMIKLLLDYKFELNDNGIYEAISKRYA